jgi:recombination protein RecA
MSTLEKALDQINKDFGAGTISALSGQPALEVTAFSTGSLNLDMALGVGGHPFW